jgi:hypothetical protein
MRKIAAVVVLGTMLVAGMPSAATAGAGYDLALALGAFTLFTQVLLAPFLVRPIYAAPPPVVYSSAPVVAASTPGVYASAPTTYATPSPRRVLVEREVVHPHGRYVLRGDGVTVAYQWIWVPNPPAGAPPPPPPR